MTVADLEEYMRQQYNAVNDTFFTAGEIHRYIYEACMILARKTSCIERVYTTSTVVDQQEYAAPDNSIEIKRITFDDVKLQPIDFREQDQLTLGTGVTVTGSPQYYALFNETIYLTPIPATVGELKIWSINEPQEVTASSTLEVPSVFHIDIANLGLAKMYGKDKQPQMATMYMNLWAATLIDVVKWARKRKRADSFANVKDEQWFSETIIGSI